MSHSQSIADRVIQGDRLALARLITHIENHIEDTRQVLDMLYPRSGEAHIIGVTGPSGTGKSTLVNVLTIELLKSKSSEDSRIGIIAVDPTSPFTGGALLGDRVRMQRHSQDSRVFIRSMASRGAAGGIARAAHDVVIAMDAAGYNPIIIETVGAGQSEVAIASLAHTTMVIEAPGLGDDVQAAKAGLLEIADILVVNKSDKPAAETTTASLRRMLKFTEEIQEQESGVQWKVPLINTSAINHAGVDQLVEAITAHQAYLRSSDMRKKSNLQRLRNQLDTMLRDALFAQWQSGFDQKAYDAIILQVMRREVSPYQAVEMLLRQAH